jgi:hypothetical protein
VKNPFALVFKSNATKLGLGSKISDSQMKDGKTFEIMMMKNVFFLKHPMILGLYLEHFQGLFNSWYVNCLQPKALVM